MNCILLAIGIIFTGIALRATRKRCYRKISVLLFILATGILCFAFTNSYITAICSMSLWILFPWLELIFLVRKQTFPLEISLKQEALPPQDYFPEASRIKKQFIDHGCTHLKDCSWNWANSLEHYSFFWHNEKKHLIAICHRIQTYVTFCYVTITSQTQDNVTWKSSNFPFKTHLPYCSKTKFNHVTQGKISCPDFMLYSHELFLYDKGIDTDQLSDEKIKDATQFFEREMRKQIDHNLQSGHIILTGDGNFKYSFKGLCFLWVNILRDMYRLC